jgi:hypothetical protein
MKSPTIWLFAALWKLRRRVHRWEWRRSGRTLAATTRGCLRAAIGDEYAPESVPVLSGITSFWPDGAPCPYPAPAGQMFLRVLGIEICVQSRRPSRK